MDVKRANKWWEKAMNAEAKKPLIQPKSPKHNRWAVPTHDSSIEPQSGRTREKVMP